MLECVVLKHVVVEGFSREDGFGLRTLDDGGLDDGRLAMKDSALMVLTMRARHGGEGLRWIGVLTKKHHFQKRSRTPFETLQAGYSSCDHLTKFWMEQKHRSPDSTLPPTWLPWTSLLAKPFDYILHLMSP